MMGMFEKERRENQELAEFMAKHRPALADQVGDWRGEPDEDEDEEEENWDSIAAIGREVSRYSYPVTDEEIAEMLMADMEEPSPENIAAVREYLPSTPAPSADPNAQTVPA